MNCDAKTEVKVEAKELLAMRIRGAVAVVGFIAVIVGANMSLAEWGIVSIGFGLSAPAGVYFAGLAFTMRDAVREFWGRKGVALAILVGAAVSFGLEDAQKFAIASGVAFLFSEAADSLVYERIRDRGWLPAVAGSNVVGLVLDSAIFLWLAFGSLAFIEGQIVGKVYMTVLAIVVIWGVRRALPQWKHQTASAS